MGGEHDKTEKTSEHTGLGTTAGRSDKDLPENSDDALDARLDQGVDETFPGSDPVSVKITK